MKPAKKDKFDSLDEDFKSASESMKPEEIRAKLAQINVDQEKLLEARDVDEDLLRCKEAAKEAGALYREGTKMNRLRTQYLMQVLRSRGVPV